MRTMLEHMPSRSHELAMRTPRKDMCTRRNCNANISNMQKYIKNEARVFLPVQIEESVRAK